MAREAPHSKAHAPYTIFLTHAGLDTDFALKLAADLKETGFNIWTTRFDLRRQDDTTSVSDQILADCSAIMPVLSASFIDAPARRAELDRASRLEKRIYPVLLNTWELPDWVRSIENYENLDFTDWRDERVYQARLTTLIDILKWQFQIEVANTPGPLERHIQRQIVSIERHKAFMRAISVPDEPEPGDRRTIYTTSMWGLHVALAPANASSGDETVTAQAVMQDQPSFVICGPNGSGKTTVLHRIALDALYEYDASKGASPLPYLLDASTWPSGQPFADYVAGAWLLDTPPEMLANSGGLILLLDRVESIAGDVERRQSLLDWMEAAGPNARLIASTTQPTDLSWLNAPAYLICPPDAASVAQYIRSHLTNGAADKLIEHLAAARSGYHNGYPRSSSWMAVAALVAFSHHNPGASYPQHTALLISWLLEHLWCYRVAPSADYAMEDIIGPLALLATEMLDEQRVYVPYSYAGQHFARDTVFRHAFNARLLAAQNDYVRFSHDTFRDYFAAVALLDDGIYTRLTQLRFDENGQRIPTRWDQAILFACGLADDTDSQLRIIAEVDPILAAECIDTGLPISANTLQQITDQFVSLIEGANNTRKQALAAALRRIADDVVVTTLLERFHTNGDPYTASAWNVDEDIAMPLKRLGADTIRFLVDILRGEQWQRRRGAAWALGKLQEPAAVPSLIEALGDENPNVRKEASEALQGIGKPAVPGLLKTLRSSNVDLRASVVQTLARMREPAAVSDLIDALADTEWPAFEEVRICDLAARALDQIGTREAQDAVGLWRENGTAISSPLAREISRRIRNQPVETATPGKPIGEVPENLVTDLDSEDWTLRRDAVKQLAEFGPDPIVAQHILTRLVDTDVQVRWAAALALEHFQGEEVVEALIRALRDADWVVCDAAAEVLGKKGIVAVPGLLAALGDASPNVRGAAAEALGQIGAEEAVEPLAALLDDTAIPRLEKTPVCHIAAEALQQIGTDAALTAVSRWWHTLSEQTSAISDNIETPLLQLDQLAYRFTDDGNPHREALLKFLDALNEQDWHSQKRAARALSDYARTLKGTHDAVALETLSQALEGGETLVRWTAIEAMAWMGDENAVPAMIEAVRDSSWTVRIAAIRGLAEIENVSALPDVVAALNDAHALVREAAAETLGIIGDVSASAYLAQSLNTDEDSFVRRAAAEALGLIQERSSVPNLIQALEDSDMNVRRAAAEALGRVGDESAVAPLTGFLDDTSEPSWDDRRMCDIVVEALENIGTLTAKDALQQWRAAQGST